MICNTICSGIQTWNEVGDTSTVSMERALSNQQSESVGTTLSTAPLLRMVGDLWHVFYILPCMNTQLWTNQNQQPEALLTPLAASILLII